MIEFSSYHVFGVRVHELTPSSFLRIIQHSIETRARSIIGNHNLHSIYLFHRDAKMRLFYECATYIFIDGMPIVFWLKFLGQPVTRENRFTSVDWIYSLMERANLEGWQVVYVGGKPGVAERGAEVLRSKFANLQIKTLHGYFNLSPGSEQSIAVIKEINDYKPDLLLVGLGMPRQEHWILDHIDQLSTPCIIPVGACLDYVAGVIPIPPRWMGKIGLEWLARLLARPGQLWRRYLFEPWFLLPYFLGDLQLYVPKLARRKWKL
jgi:N-acetylglucosaminyldiphosphoundecaprenol N-acetyl-beta-D-mannosaminyltransferase